MEEMLQSFYDSLKTETVVRNHPKVHQVEDFQSED
jgi:hypothetical protein